MYLNSLRSACEANRKRTMLTAISLAFVPFGFPLSAQQNVAYSTLSGRVTDGSGAVVRGALIQFRSVDTNQQEQSITGGEGLYRFAYLKPGSYLVSAHSAGFKDAARNLVLTVGGASTLDFQLSVQQAKASIDVSSDLQSQRTQISEVVRTREIDNLPLNGRNYLNLTLLGSQRLQNEPARKFPLRHYLGSSRLRHFHLRSAKPQQQLSGGWSLEQ